MEKVCWKIHKCIKHNLHLTIIIKIFMENMLVFIETISVNYASVWSSKLIYSKWLRRNLHCNIKNWFVFRIRNSLFEIKGISKNLNDFLHSIGRGCNQIPMAFLITRCSLVCDGLLHTAFNKTFLTLKNSRRVFRTDLRTFFEKKFSAWRKKSIIKYLINV